MGKGGWRQVHHRHLKSSEVDFKWWGQLNMEGCHSPIEHGKWATGQTTWTGRAFERLHTEHGILRVLQGGDAVWPHVCRVTWEGIMRDPEGKLWDVDSDLLYVTSLGPTS